MIQQKEMTPSMMVDAEHLAKRQETKTAMLSTMPMMQTDQRIGPSKISIASDILFISFKDKRWVSSSNDT